MGSDRSDQQDVIYSYETRDYGWILIYFDTGLESNMRLIQELWAV